MIEERFSFLARKRFNKYGPEGFQRASGKPFGRLRRGETLRKTGRSKEGLSLAFHKESVSCGRFRPPAGGRGTFPHGKVPKGCRGRPKGACLMAAPGPPVAKIQCTASLAGARPAGFTSVPGRATVAFGAADPSPGIWAPVYPWCVSKGPLRQAHLAAVRAPAKVPCKVRAQCGPCRSRSRVKHPSVAKKARRLSHLRAYFYSTYCHFST